MTLKEIKSSVLDGKCVFWKNSGYEVIVDNIGQWMIRCSLNYNSTGYTYIGLTWLDEVTMNGKPEDFYIG